MYDQSLGLYIADTEHDDEDDDHNLNSWHQNWLFKQANTVHANNVMKMASLILPNATDDVKAQIGNKDFDLVSEFTEDVAEAFDDSTTDEDMNNDVHSDEGLETPVRNYSCNMNSHLRNLRPSPRQAENPSHKLLTRTLLKPSILAEMGRNDNARGYLWLGEEIGESSTDDIVLYNDTRSDGVSDGGRDIYYNHREADASDDNDQLNDGEFVREDLCCVEDALHRNIQVI